MKITLEKIEKHDDPYQLFLDYFKNNETRRKYNKILLRFLELVPNKLYEDSGIAPPKYQQVGILASCFIQLAEKNPKLVRNIIASYLEEDNKLVEDGKLNPNTVPNHIKPIKALLDSNNIPLHWKSLTRMFPRKKVTEDRAYTREELQRMIEASPDITDKLIIEIFSSAGFRLESWDYFTWKDVIPFKKDDGSFKGAALLVYRGDPESYWTFITPEACQTLENYKQVWKEEVNQYPKPDDPLLKAIRFSSVRRLYAKGVKRRLEKIVKKIGLRQALPETKRRHEIPLDHGFRKYFNTMMRRAKVNYLDKEDMMGHTTGLEKHYERYNEEDFERFSEYEKAIPFLTISDTERIKLENTKLKSEKIELEKSIPQLVNEAIERVKNELITDGYKPHNQ